MINRILFKAVGGGGGFLYQRGRISDVFLFLVRGACNPGALLEDGRGGGYKQ